MSKYEPVIGLEVHAELLTESKMFCNCAVVDSTQAEPNLYVCPVCAGMPGVLPVINRKAIEYAIMVGLALHCEVNEFSQFARKSYFYPDLPKGYQISQYEHPLSSNGWLEIELEGGSKRIGVTRAHMEEDTGKLFHVDGHSLVDLNRAGVPLLEIVSEPDMHSIEEIEAYVRKVRAILVYLGVNSGDMSKGVLRFEANVSIRPAGSDKLYTRTEIKNLNSIRALVRSVAYEIERQTRIVESGGEVIQQTMGYNEETGETYTQRGKEHAHDYRYFPEPDLPPLRISREWVEEIRARLPELPDAKRERFVGEFGLGRYDAGVLVADKAVADYFETGVEAGGDPKALANWITGELFRLMNAADMEIEQVKVTPQALVELIGLVKSGTINNNTAKDVLGVLFEEGGSPRQVIEARGLAQISDQDALAGVVAGVLAENPDQVADYLGGKEGLLGWFVGQVMRATRGQANAQLVRELLTEQLDSLRKQAK
jgi:aspartyl-tRNA(Asn)/glutamyl-tRNA(Gln) amidotransferase subunit B